MIKTKTLWKTIPESFENHGHKWEMDKWFKFDGKLELCLRGFHTSEKILDAMSYIIPGWICMVNVRGKSVVGNDKSCWSEMMITERKAWTKEMSVKLAIFAAELVIDIYEKKYPTDNRPRNAIEVAKNYLKNPNSAAGAAARDAAGAAGAAAGAAAWAAGAAAWAAWAARAAAWAAWAARDAAWAARDAAWAAGAAARDAAGAAAREKLLAKIEKKIKQLVGLK